MQLSPQNGNAPPMDQKSHNRKKTPIRQAFGIKIRMRRFEMGITQEELAERANLHPTYVGSAERGERNVSLENIVLIARALDYSPKDLMPD